MTTPKSYQADFADAPGAPDEMVRGGLEGDVMPPVPVNDPLVVLWAVLTGPWLNDRQRISLLTLARFFTADTTRLMITQDALAQAVGWTPRTLIKRLKELVELDLITIEAVYQNNLQVANAYSLAGLKTGWQPAPMTAPSADPVLAHKNRLIDDSKEYIASLETALGEDHPAVKPGVQNLHREEEEELIYITSDYQDNFSSTSPQSGVKSFHSGSGKLPDPDGCHPSYRDHVVALLTAHPDITDGFKSGPGAAVGYFVSNPGKLEAQIVERQAIAQAPRASQPSSVMDERGRRMPRDAASR